MEIWHSENDIPLRFPLPAYKISYETMRQRSCHVRHTTGSSIPTHLTPSHHSIPPLQPFFHQAPAKVHNRALHLITGCHTASRKSESMAKWEENTNWSKIDFLISVFFFFYWINMCMKDNEWPLKCFRGRKISLHCPVNVDMSEYWRKNDFLPKFFKVIFDWFNFCVQKRSSWDMLG